MLVDLEKAHRGFKKQAFGSVQTGRGFSFYEGAFYDGEAGAKLAGKLVLDVGAGKSDFASKAALLRGEVVAFDLDFSSWDGIPDRGAKRVTGLAQELPFMSDIFDEVVASYSLYWIEKGLAETLRDMLRVAKCGGKVKIFPAFRAPGDSERAPIPFQGKVVYSQRAEGTRLELTKPADLTVEELDQGVQDIINSFNFTTPFRRAQLSGTQPLSQNVPTVPTIIISQTLLDNHHKEIKAQPEKISLNPLRINYKEY